MPAPSEMGGAGTTGHAPIPEEEEDDEEVDEAGVEAKVHFTLVCSVADPGCLYRITDPDIYPSRIPNPKTATKERGEKKIC
jgi:hypothetical protein